MNESTGTISVEDLITGQVPVVAVASLRLNAENHRSPGMALRISPFDLSVTVRSSTATQ